MPRSVTSVLHDLEVEVEVPLGLAGAVWERLGVEPEARAVPGRVPARRWRPAHPAWAGLAVAALLAFVAAVGLVLVPRPESAAAVLRAARNQFDTPPSLSLTVERRVGAAVVAEETHRPQSEGWVFITQIDYGDATHWRRQFVRDDATPGSAGTVEVSDGTYLATIDPARGIVSVGPVTAATVTAPLDVVDPALHEGPRLDERSLDKNCTIEPNATIAGQSARHLRCLVEPIAQDGLRAGDRADVFLDATTGLVLRIIQPNGSGHTVTSLRYGVDHPKDRFTITVPHGYDIEWTGAGAPPGQFRPRPPASGTVSAVPFPDARPLDILPTQNGVIVALAGGEPTDLRSGRLARLDPITGAVQATIDVPELPAAYALGDGLPEGSPVGTVSRLVAGPGVVYAFDAFTQRVHLLDARTMSFSGDPIVTGDAQHQAVDILAGDGGLWVSRIDNRPVVVGGVEAQGAGGELVQLDGSGRETARVALNGAPRDRMVEAFGSVWLTASELDPADPRGPERAMLYRVDPLAAKIVARIPVPGTGLLAAGGDAVWLGAQLSAGGGSLVRVDPANGTAAARTPIPSPGGMAVEPLTGLVWVSDSGGKAVSAVDGAGRIARSVEVGRAPGAIAAGNRAMWVAVDGARAVVRIAL